MRPGETDSIGRVWVEAPNQYPPQTSTAIWGVWLAPNEEVVWTWTHLGTTSYVSGYTIGVRVGK